ncbi:MAG: ATP synthase F1 subunit gamma [Deltaproteobacteria bacterium]|nr:ATP synthase F1 subunit gamma [Deltaproteobacteria bacterium]
MPSLKDIKRRIKSVKNTQQITKAMKMVSAAKLKRAQDEIVAARPYAEKMLALISSLTSKAAPGSHPFLTATEGNKVGLVFITSDRGLCGGYNSVLVRNADRFISERADAAISLYLIGKRAIEHFKRRQLETLKARPMGSGRPDYPAAAQVAKDVMDAYLKGELNEVYIIYSEFKSALAQRPVVQKLLPVSGVKGVKDEEEAEAAPFESESGSRLESKPKPKPKSKSKSKLEPGSWSESGIEAARFEYDYIYEPSKEAVLASLLPKYIEVQAFRALLESSASEHGARMTAMDSASKNAAEMIGALSLKYNRLRQAVITKELMEIIGGSEALKS